VGVVEEVGCGTPAWLAGAKMLPTSSIKAINTTLLIQPNILK
jgi:hypothetical protein